jgi:hypothetical protein
VNDTVGVSLDGGGGGVFPISAGFLAGVPGATGRDDDDGDGDDGDDGDVAVDDVGAADRGVCTGACTGAGAGLGVGTTGSGASRSTTPSAGFG